MTLSFSQEAHFSTTFKRKIAPFWQQRQDGFTAGQGQQPLYWAAMTAPQHKKAIVVVNGRIESVWKYQELFYDLFQQGYDIYSYDHRGQGLSARLCPDPQMGYVEHFEDYVHDLATLVEQWPLEGYQSCHLLAHSMGGAIATRYLQNNPDSPFDAMALSSPMFGVCMPWYLRPIARQLSQLLAACHSSPNYAPGHGSYYAKPFLNNRLTQSKNRYQWFRDLYESMPALKLGGPSSHWVAKSLRAAQSCIDDAKQLHLPTLILQAELDKIVANPSQQRFADQAGDPVALQVIKNARHEILFEVDPVRNQALQALLQHFEKY